MNKSSSYQTDWLRDHVGISHKAKGNTGVLISQARELLLQLVTGVGQAQLRGRGHLLLRWDALSMVETGRDTCEFQHVFSSQFVHIPIYLQLPRQLSFWWTDSKSCSAFKAGVTGTHIPVVSATRHTTCGGSAALISM